MFAKYYHIHQRGIHDTPRLFFACTSKNAVKAIKFAAIKSRIFIGIIADIEQVNDYGGYSGLSSEELYYLVKPRIVSTKQSYKNEFSNFVVLVRNGLWFRDNDLDGIYVNSLKNDINIYDMIHIDGFAYASKKIQQAKSKYSKEHSFISGALITNNIIDYCNALGYKGMYEIGTSCDIYNMTTNQFCSMLLLINKENVSYVHVQNDIFSLYGNLYGRENERKLIQEIRIAKSYDLYTKNTNCDFLSLIDLQKQFTDGLNAAGFNDTLAVTEMDAYLDLIANDYSAINTLYDIVMHNGQFARNLTKNIDLSDQRNVIRFGGKYILNSIEFEKEIKPYLDKKSYKCFNISASIYAERAMISIIKNLISVVYRNFLPYPLYYHRKYFVNNEEIKQ